MHNDSPINGLDAQVPNAAAGSPGDRTFQAAVLFSQSETQSVDERVWCGAFPPAAQAPAV